MSAVEKQKTKTKIIQAARELFSQLGFDGTSVRQIAEKSDVNIAAVNYHFKSKHGLYWAIIEEAHLWMEAGVKDLVVESQNMEELARSLFQYMRSGESYIRSTMKTYLTDGVPSENEGEGLSCVDDFGPPGGKFVFEFLKKEYGENVSDAAIHWAVFSIFSSLFHWATMCSSSSFQEMKKGHLDEDMIEKNIIHMTRAVLSYMETNKDWES